MNTIRRTRNAISDFQDPRKAFRFPALCALLAFGWFCGSVEAQLPQKINYQGFLSSPSTGPITTLPASPLSMTFKLFDVATGGAALWTETQSVTVTPGVFNVQLNTAINVPALAFDKPYFLETTIGTGPSAEILNPRQPLASSPYALRAATADAATTAGTISGSIIGSQVTGVINSGTLPAANLTGTIGTAQIADNAVTQAKLSPVSGAVPGRVLGTDGSNLQWQTASAGTVTSVGTDSGLTGGPITGSGTISLATTQLLPAIACSTNQIVKWNGSAWVCATASLVGADSAFDITLGAIAALSCTT
ncbi:MAG: hypothetical protein JWP08_2457, partial [Bryobacterales bacterium]|nr:hypothetical protein [Bryobacterales bacterium]